MDMLIIIGCSILGIMFGVLFGVKYVHSVTNKKNREEKEKVGRKFLESYVQISTGKSWFKSRTMNTCYLKLNIPSEGDIELLYLIDKKDLAIVKNNEIIYTTQIVDKTIVSETIDIIELFFKEEINNTINVFGLLFYKKTFENAFGEKLDSFEDLIVKMYERGKTVSSQDPMQNIVKGNVDKHDIDEILDKISKKGITSLSAGEKEYLNYYSNNK